LSDGHTVTFSTTRNESRSGKVQENPISVKVELLQNGKVLLRDDISDLLGVSDERFWAAPNFAGVRRPMHRGVGMRFEDRGDLWELRLRRAMRDENPRQVLKIIGYLNQFEVRFLGTDRDSSTFKAPDDEVNKIKIDNGKRILALQKDLDNLISQVRAQQSLENLDLETFVEAHQARIQEAQGNLAELLTDESKLAQLRQEILDTELKYSELGIIKGVTSREASKIDESLSDFKGEINRALETAYRMRLKQLELFDYAFRRLELFNEILHEKFFKKVVRISNGHLEIASKKSDIHSENDLDFEKLSSGEKQFLVLIHSMLIKSTADKEKQLIFLVDEPELSLQGDWLMSFSDDMNAIQTRTGAQMIFTSHNIVISGFDDLSELEVLIR